MLIRISGGHAGLSTYLKHGQKQDRAQTRDQLDERLILSGDLDIFENLVQNVPTQSKTAERYNHITLSFKEHFVPKKVMQDILEEFKTFISAAYQSDELYLYAEAHLPRIKTTINPKTGEIVQRLPHIHITIPLVNMVTGQRLNTFGFVPKSIQHIDAFQEYINQKYALASPKDAPRTEPINTIDRLGGRDFLGRDHLELKTALAQKIMTGEIESLQALAAELAPLGQVNIANPTKPLAEQYARLVTHDGQAIRLRSQMFRAPFLAKTPQEKQTILARHQNPAYTLATPTTHPMTEQSILDAQKAVPALQYWHHIRAKEIKHLNPNSRFFKGAYAEMDDHQKREALAQFDKQFDQKWRNYPTPDPIELLDQPEPDTQDLPAPLDITANADLTNVLQQVSNFAEEAHITAQADDLIAEIRRQLDPQLLLAILAESHGLNPEHYRTQPHPKTGAPLITVGRRSFTVSDFLTKEMNLRWAEAREILESAYQEQQKGLKPAPQWADPEKDLWHEFYTTQYKPQLDANREALADLSQHAKQERKAFAAKAKQKVEPLKKQPAALSIAKLENARERAAINLKLTRLRASFKLDARAEFRQWLQKQAQLGRLDALTKLKALSKLEHHDPQHDSLKAKHDDPLEARLTLLDSIRYTVRESGDVQYTLPDASQFIDTGRRITFEQPEKSDAAILAALNLAVEKFGTHLELSGSDDFKRRAKDIAQQQGLRIQIDEEVRPKPLKPVWTPRGCDPFR